MGATTSPALAVVSNVKLMHDNNGVTNKRFNEVAADSVAPTVIYQTGVRRIGAMWSDSMRAGGKAGLDRADRL